MAEKRLEILSRDGFRCQKCFSAKRTLHVHHKSYSNEFQNPWEYPNNWLITLCEDCHKLESIPVHQQSSLLREIAIRRFTEVMFEERELLEDECKNPPYTFENIFDILYALEKLDLSTCRDAVVGGLCMSMEDAINLECLYMD